MPRPAWVHEVPNPCGSGYPERELIMVSDLACSAPLSQLSKSSRASILRRGLDDPVREESWCCTPFLLLVVDYPYNIKMSVCQALRLDIWLI